MATGADPEAGNVRRNAREVFSVRDLILNTKHAFMPSYQDYVLQVPYEGAPEKTFRANTYLFGNIDDPNSSDTLFAAAAREVAAAGNDDAQRRAAPGRRDGPATRSTATRRKASGSPAAAALPQQTRRF